MLFRKARGRRTGAMCLLCRCVLGSCWGTTSMSMRRKMTSGRWQLTSTASGHAWCLLRASHAGYGKGCEHARPGGQTSGGGGVTHRP